MADKPKMTLEQFVKLFDIRLDVKGYFNRKGFACTTNSVNWSASLPDASFAIQGGMLSSCVGFGETPEIAIDDLAAKIEGKQLTIKAYNQPLRELLVDVEFTPLVYPANIT